jgi:hypothetical protein
LSAHHGAIADGEMTRHPHLAGEHGPAAHHGTPGDAHLGDQHRVIADNNVVGNLHEIINFYAIPDPRLAEARAVNRDIGPDLDIIPHHHNADLRDLGAHALLVHLVAEAIAANHRPVVHDDALAQTAMLADGYLRINPRLIANLDAVAQIDLRAHHHIVTQHHIGLDHRMGTHRRILSQARPGTHHGGGMNARLGCRRGQRKRQRDLREGLLRLFDPDQRRRHGLGPITTHNQGASRAGRGIRGIAGLGDKSDIVGTRIANARHAANGTRGIALHLSTQTLRDLAYRQHHGGRTSYLPLLSRVISSMVMSALGSK